MTQPSNAPYGGVLVDRLATPERADALKAEANRLPSWTLTGRALSDLEMIVVGAFSPLTGFMTREEYESVEADMRLPGGLFWPLPVTLEVTADQADEAGKHDRIALRDPEGTLLAILTVSDVWPLNGTHAVGGDVEGVEETTQHDFRRFRLTPAEARREFAKVGWRRIAAFHTDRPLHRREVEQVTRAARSLGANLVIQPAIGVSDPGDRGHYANLRAFEAVLQHFSAYTTRLSLLPLVPREGGPRELLWNAIVRKNYGVTDLILEADEALVDEARALIAEHGVDLDMTFVPTRPMEYVDELRAYVPVEEIEPGAHILSVGADGLLDRLRRGRAIPEWFSYPGVIEALRGAHPPRQKQGFTVFLTGLSGSGKSTIAKVVRAMLMQDGSRAVSLLDGDIVRRCLSSELGFSKEHRDLNIRRIGFVAAEITRAGGAAICAPIAPYRATRHEVREMVEPGGGFVLVHVSTPIEVCEARDRKGLYRRARAGEIPAFTGVSDPYEEPRSPDIVIDTSGISPEQAGQEVILYLQREGYLAAHR